MNVNHLPGDTRPRNGSGRSLSAQSMNLPQSTLKVAPIRRGGVGVQWTGAVLLWGASTAYDLFARKIEEAAEQNLYHATFNNLPLRLAAGHDKDPASSVVLPGVA